MSRECPLEESSPAWPPFARLLKSAQLGHRALPMVPKGVEWERS